MSANRDDDQHNAELVPLHPRQEVPETGAPDVLAAVPADTSDEIDLGDVPEAAVYVDTTRKSGARLPVIPDSVKGLDNIRATVAHHGGRASHTARYHAVRSPKYLALTVVWAVAGVFLLGARQVGWWWVREQHTLRSLAAAGGDSREWLRLHNNAREVRKVRGLILLAEVAALAAAAAGLVLYGNVFFYAAAGLIIVPALARYGHGAGRSIISPAMVTPRFRKLTGDIVLRAYLRRRAR